MEVWFDNCAGKGEGGLYWFKNGWVGLAPSMGIQVEHESGLSIVHGSYRLTGQYFGLRTGHLELEPQATQPIKLYLPPHLTHSLSVNTRSSFSAASTHIGRAQMDGLAPAPLQVLSPQFSATSSPYVLVIMLPYVDRTGHFRASPVPQRTEEEDVAPRSSWRKMNGLSPPCERCHCSGNCELYATYRTSHQGAVE
ncbi:hypothetical protein N656DRAFT_253692 [Canariomyces notabilis]|uniref:Uncharacterized protein n=1 Tax=Canariomyces notabilis TaxID=2074819 RepID=A0AAN6YWV0_9PEZI|nr:hypothetical protein N656DRAFT_253692 [Canariomyces arenarius]